MKRAKLHRGDGGAGLLYDAWQALCEVLGVEEKRCFMMHGLERPQKLAST